MCTRINQCVFILVACACLTCSETADDTKVVARCKQLFNQAEKLSLAMVLFPWLPSPSMLMGAWTTKQIYDIVVRAMNVRKQSIDSRSDALQMLLDSGEAPEAPDPICRPALTIRSSSERFPETPGKIRKKSLVLKFEDKRFR